MRARAAATTAAVGVVTTWMAAPWVALALGRSLDETARARVRAVPGRTRPSSSETLVVPLRPRPTWAAVPTPRPAADAVRRTSTVG
jgi:hypothetical protein